jgi:isopentenyl diphosphate isomerase/L-lactate dehydrogenase-like FMN-dependent dehydrogenase
VLRTLRQEIDTTLALIGCTRAADLSPDFVRVTGRRMGCDHAE